MKVSLSKKIILLLAPAFIYIFMRLLWLTTRKHFNFAEVIEKEKQYLCTCWHGELLFSPQAYRKLHPKNISNAMISRHFDGEIIARTLSFLNITAIRGSSSKGGARVFLEAFKRLKRGEEILITPDGPRGPRHTLGEGIISLAQKLNLPIFIMSYQASGYWQLKSWDKFIIPKPFSKVEFFAQSIDITDKSEDEAKKILKDAMMRYTIA
ncbi:MAG: lysophospholipid acyltransferase family protein [Campylobacterales bacterium]|nr:lysophospholipid acyltransferase family protein [Campylobacterales bacterium]